MLGDCLKSCWLRCLIDNLNVLTGAAKSLTFPMHLTPMISFSGYARSPGAGEYFWMSLSMYACNDQQTITNLFKLG